MNKSIEDPILTKIKLFLNIKDSNKDPLLSLIIENETTNILNITRRKEIKNNMIPILLELVIWRYNLIGIEGLQSESYSGVSNSFMVDIPPHITLKLKPFRLVKMR